MPSTSVLVATDQLPALSAVVVAIVDVPSVTMIVLDASAVPFNVGVVTFVGDDGVDATTEGAFGAVVSITKVNDDDATDTFPSASAAVAVKA